jgi:hypothetical protein
VIAGPVIAFLHLIALLGLGVCSPLEIRSRLIYTKWRRSGNLNRFGIELLTYGFIVGVIGALHYHVRLQRRSDGLPVSFLQAFNPAWIARYFVSLFLCLSPASVSPIGTD